MKDAPTGRVSFAGSGCRLGRGRDAAGMREVADVPIVGGPADGRTATVELDDRGDPPAELHPGEVDVVGDGLYVREPVVGAGPPWTYHWQATS